MASKLLNHGDVVKSGRVVYKAVRGGGKEKNDWFILKCKTVGDGVAISHSDFGSQRVKFKVPALIVEYAEKVVGGYCGHCRYSSPKRLVLTGRQTFTSDWDDNFKYRKCCVVTAKDYVNSTYCGQGLHTWPTKRAALAYCQ